MRYRTSTLISLSLFIAFLSLGQGPRSRLDSLSSVARSHANDTLGVLACADLCYEYRFVNQDSALNYGRKGIALGRRLSFKSGLSQVYSDAATVHYDRGDLDSAILLWESSLAIRTELSNKSGMASTEMKLGAALFRKGAYDDALRHQLNALRIFEELKFPQGMGLAMNNVAAVYQHQNHLDKALEYYQQAYSLHSEHDQKPEMGMALLNIGNVHFLRKDYNTARQCYRGALVLIPEEQQPTNRGIALNNLSEIYTVADQLDSAVYYTQEALALRRRTGDVGGIISSLNMLGRIHAKMKEYGAGERYLREALTLANEKAILYEQGRVYENLFQLYRDMGDWKKSLDAHVMYATIRDSLLNEAGRKEVAALQVQYETEKQKQQIAFQAGELSEKQLRIERDSIIIAGLVVTFALLVVIVVLLRNRQRRKAEILRTQSEIALREAYIRATIESQETERKRFARDLHDGMGQWISSLRLALSEVQLAQNNEEKLAVLARVDNIMHDINSEFRSIAFNLMPHTLIHSGLTAALNEMVRRLNANSKIVFSVIVFEFPERLTELMEISLYRIIQEWTNNILKYSNATKVEIQLTGHEDELIILIEDNGRGFDLRDLADGSGNGWKNICSRINLIKGVVDIDSSPTRMGTTLTLTVPRVSVEETVDS